VSGVAPAFLGVVNVYRASQHEEILGVHDHAIPCRQFHLLGEGSRLRVAPIKVEDLEFQFAFHFLLLSYLLLSVLDGFRLGYRWDTRG
jgi:hypothetical protein